MKRLYDADALYVMLPWLVSEFEATMTIMGSDFWPYGIEANRHALETFLRHLQNQGLVDGELGIEHLFAANGLVDECY